MKIRRVVFWAHLCAGVAAGLLVLLMSATGILLAYEPQLVAHADAGNRIAVRQGVAALRADLLVAAAREHDPAAARGTLILSADSATPARITLGRDRSLLLNPYSGELLADQAAGTRELLQAVERWHRWLGGTPGTAGAGLIGAANLAFLFLVCSGIYLWLPPRLSWTLLRVRLLFSRHSSSSRARDYNWHHVFSSWALVPLAVIVLSGVIMSYPWANRLLFAAFGEVPSLRGGPAVERPQRGGTSVTEASNAQTAVGGSAARVSLDALLAAARAHFPQWQTLRMPLGGEGAFVVVSAEVAGEPSVRHGLRISTRDPSQVTEVVQPAGGMAGSATPGQKARRWLRFAHTGEEYGVVGRAVAALASLAACFLVYSGLALAFRRLILPLLARPADSRR